MAIFPKIQSPCPYKDRLSSVMDGDFCRMCKRQVVDLTDMSDADRVALIAGCKTEVCVSYRVPVRAALVATAISVAAAIAPTAAAACDTTEVIVTVGGIKDPANVEFVTDQSGETAPTLPIVYERARSDQPKGASNDPTNSPVNSPARS